MTWLLSLPLVLGILLSGIFLGTAALGLYALVRSCRPWSDSDDVDQAAVWGARSVGTIYALIVSLTFANLNNEFSELSETIDNEALALEQLYRGLDAAYGTEVTDLQSAIANYTRLVIDEEWAAMRNGEMLFTADAALDEIRLKLIALRQSDSQVIFPNALLNDINDAENARGQRGFDIFEPTPMVFWVIALASLAGTIVCASVHPPSAWAITAIGVFGALNGAIFYAILAHSHPFLSVVDMQPTALETVYQRTMLTESSASSGSRDL